MEQHKCTMGRNVLPLLLAPVLLAPLLASSRAEPAAGHKLSCGTGAQVHALDGRQYWLRLPATCDPDATLPTLVLVHCYGCSASNELSKYADTADEFGFAIVAPEGLGNSFNAPHCCGQSHRRGVDDVGFIDAAVAAAGARARLSTTALFAAGFSNGGFMVSHLPSTSALRWAAISPAAGHEYAVLSKRPLPVYMHHCAEDRMVSPNGCCVTDGQPTCCCGIGLHRNACVPTLSLHREWMSINRCSGEVSAPGPAGTDCYVGVGCEANTTLCMHHNCIHPQWASEFPAARSVLDFFARVACEGAGGRFVAGAKGQDIGARCRCPAGRRGRWCLELD